MIKGRRAAAAAAVMLAMTLACGCGESAGGAAQRPEDFFGVVSDQTFAHDDPAYRARVLHQQRDAGIRLIRQVFDWSLIERSQGHFDLSYHDRYVTALARAHVSVLPILFRAPPFRAQRRPELGGPTYPPSDPRSFGRFAAVLVRRYGPGGSFWREHPDLPRMPIRAWQIWNEPNLPQYWPPAPDPVGYTRLLGAASHAIKRQDPGAQVVSAGLAESRLGLPVSRFMRGMFAAGAGRYLDVLAVHAFAEDAEESVLAIERAHKLLRRLHARVPIWVTEVGWASAGPPSAFTTSERGQAIRVERTLDTLRERRRQLDLRGVVYFAWRDARPYPGGDDFFGLHTGLLRLDGSPKPALRAYERAVER